MLAAGGWGCRRPAQGITDYPGIHDLTRREDITAGKGERDALLVADRGEGPDDRGSAVGRAVAGSDNANRAQYGPVEATGRGHFRQAVLLQPVKVLVRVARRVLPGR